MEHKVGELYWDVYYKSLCVLTKMKNGEFAVTRYDKNPDHPVWGFYDALKYLKPAPKFIKYLYGVQNENSNNNCL